ncbi:hypothetical protein GW17_00045105 [Ensete ventricosum]|nr:hypothetical protein GW17_00045105 [Ensete ventricosum]RZR82258.1 hypothetical protein BHM03_00008629 [Ensete ventricosum]
MALGGEELLLAFVVALCLCATGAEPQLEVGFYSYSCPAAELIVKEEVEKVLQDDPGVGADLLRMHFHDCFVRVSRSLSNGDATLDQNYAAYLKTQCPPGSNNTVSMDPKTPRKFDNRYYRLILKNQALFTSDQTLVSTQGTATQVKRLAKSYKRFQKKFADAIVKMGAIEVLTGSEGEIRADCKVVN